VPLDVLYLKTVKFFMFKTCFRACLIALLFVILTHCGGVSANKTETSGEETEESSQEAQEELEIFIPEPGGSLPVTSFGEIWAYVVAGYESSYRRGLPISDIGYFGAEIDAYGSLTAVPRRQNLSSFNGRVHMVVACNGRALSHFVLAPESRERRALIADLLAAARNFDGLQIDFENVPPRDGEAFFSFLRELRAGLEGKIFTIALPARTRRIADDVYDYEIIKPHVNKILVMAYDEHWSTSRPGPVASLLWCRRVAEYSLRAIGPEKLIMGIPFYGRAWANQSHSRALIYSTTERLLGEHDESQIRREDGIPTFDYDVNISVKVYFEDEHSLSTRMEMYKSMNVNAVGFWRLGQETPKLWNIITLTR
jgi:spore germination protein YaaH